MLLEAPVYPGKEGLDMRLAVRESMKLFGFSREPKLTNVIFNRIERTDAPERLNHTLGLYGLRINELATRMTPA